MSNPRLFSDQAESKETTEKKSADVVFTQGEVMSREEYERQLAEAKQMAFGI